MPGGKQKLLAYPHPLRHVPGKQQGPAVLEAKPAIPAPMHLARHHPYPHAPTLRGRPARTGVNRGNPKEQEILSPVLEKISPIEGRHVLVLCSATGDVAFWLDKRMKTGRVVGLELSEAQLKAARARAKDLAPRVALLPAERTRMPFPTRPSTRW